VRIAKELPQTPSHKVVKRVLAAEGWRTGDPVWWRPPAARPAAFRELTPADLARIEDDFTRHGRQHLLER
jgi:fatty-acyl-CoA synthase